MEPTKRMKLLKELLYESNEGQFDWIKDEHGNIRRVLKDEFKVPTQEMIKDEKNDN